MQESPQMISVGILQGTKTPKFSIFLLAFCFCFAFFPQSLSVLLICPADSLTIYVTFFLASGMQPLWGWANGLD